MLDVFAPSIAHPSTSSSCDDSLGFESTSATQSWPKRSHFSQSRSFGLFSKLGDCSRRVYPVYIVIPHSKHTCDTLSVAAYPYHHGLGYRIPASCNASFFLSLILDLEKTPPLQVVNTHKTVKHDTSGSIQSWFMYACLTYSYT